MRSNTIQFEKNGAMFSYLRWDGWYEKKKKMGLGLSHRSVDLEVSLEYIHIYHHLMVSHNINASQALSNRFLCIQHVDALVGIEGVA